MAPFPAIPVAEGRARAREEFVTDAPLEPVLEVEDLDLAAPRGPVPLRRYRPGTGTLALVVLFHGGGWTINDLDTHDRLCRRIADVAGAVVAVGVDHHLKA